MPCSVVILEPGEPHTGGPADAPGFVYRVMYPAAELLSDGLNAAPRFREPVVIDPVIALELRRVHAALSQAVEPLEAESRLSWLLGALVRRHAAQAPPAHEDRGAVTGAVARQVMTLLADQLTCPPALTEIAAEAGLSRYQLLRSFRAEVGMPSYAYTPAAIHAWPDRLPSGRVLASLAALGVVCTACAFIVFLELIKEVGTSRAMVFTYVNPAVAVAAGVVLLGESFTATIAASFVLVLGGSLLATSRQGDRTPAAEPVPGADPDHLPADRT